LIIVGKENIAEMEKTRILIGGAMSRDLAVPMTIRVVFHFGDIYSDDEKKC